MGKKKDAKDPDSDLEILERFDPEVDAEVDGDPAYEARLKDESIPSDRHPVWVHVDQLAEYKARGYRDVRAGEGGYEMLSGLEFEPGQAMTFRDHRLLDMDKELHNKRSLRERSANRKARQHMLSAKNTGGTVYVNSPNGGRMQTRG